MKNFTFLLITISIITSSCSTLKISDFPQGASNFEKLPALNAVFDYHSFNQAYPDYYATSGVQINLDDNFGIQTGGIYGRGTSPQTKVLDAVHLFEREVRDNISRPTGEIYGAIICKVGLGNTNNSLIHPIISGLTLGIANLFGYPLTEVEDELEVIIEIRDAKNYIVGQYAAIGVGKAKITFYENNRDDAAHRLAHARAFVNAMDKIKIDLSRNHDELTSLLTDKGPVIFENVYE